MSDHSRDPFEILAEPVRPLRPSPPFARQLRARLLDALDLDAAAEATTGAIVVPYLAVRGAADALDWYADVFAAVEVMRVTGDDGRVGHAEFTVGAARFHLADEYPEIGVVGPESLGGTSVALHLTVDDVDAWYARAVDAGATPHGEPADQAHGARHGTLVDPFGHRWMLSQEIAPVDIDTYRTRVRDDGYTVTQGADHAAVAVPPVGGQIWAAMPYADARAGIRFLIDVLGFEEQIVVPDDDDPSVIIHSQLRWPEGGVLQAATANRPGNVYSQRPIGSESLYVVTADPDAVWQRCRAAGVEVIAAPSEPDYAPGTMNFSIRDPEGNIFTFGSYGGQS